MARGTWLVKTEPSTFSWDDLVRDGGTRWDGVRNALARNHLAAIKKDAKLAGIDLVRQSRLSVMPLAAAAFERILSHAGTKAPR